MFFKDNHTYWVKGNALIGGSVLSNSVFTVTDSKINGIYPIFSNTVVGVDKLYEIDRLLEPDDVVSIADVVGSSGLWINPSQRSALFQDGAGTTPATAPGQPVGLVLDMSKVLGPERASGVTLPSPDSSATTLGLYQEIVGLPNDGFFKFDVEVRVTGSGTYFLVGFGNSTTQTAQGIYWNILSINNTPAVGVWTRFSGIVRNNDTDGLIYFKARYWGSDTTLEVRNLTVRELPGNHARQPTALSRPTLGRWPKGGRRNLLPNSTSTGAVAGPTGTPPTGWGWNAGAGPLAISGDELTFTASGSRIIMSPASIPFAANEVQTWSVTCVANPNGLVMQQLFTPINVTGLSSFPAFANGLPVTRGVYVPQPGDRLHYVLTALNAATSVTYRIGAGVSGNATGSVTLRDPQAEAGGTITPYQRVTTNYDITEGQNRRNLLTRAETIPSSPWQINRSAADGGAASGPDGSMTARVITVNSQYGAIIQRDAVSASAATGMTYTASVWIRRVSGNSNLFLRAADTASVYSQAITITDDWQRYSATFIGDGVYGMGLVVQDRNAGGFGQFAIWHPQLELGSEPTPYQSVTTGYEDFGGVPSVWHLYNDGGDSLPVTLPAGTYGRAAIDHLGNVAVGTVTLATAGPVETLVHQRQADVMIRQGAFSALEIAMIEAYASWMIAA